MSRESTKTVIAHARINAAIFEVLESRQLMAATQLESLVPTPTSESSTIEVAKKRSSTESSSSLAPRVPVIPNPIKELNSRPGAFKKIYLDFNGSPAFNWYDPKEWVVHG